MESTQMKNKQNLIDRSQCEWEPAAWMCGVRDNGGDRTSVVCNWIDIHLLSFHLINLSMSCGRMSSVDRRQPMTTATVGVGTWLFHHIIIPITKPDLVGVTDSCDAPLTTNRCVTPKRDSYLRRDCVFIRMMLFLCLFTCAVVACVHKLTN